MFTLLPVFLKAPKFQKTLRSSQDAVLGSTGHVIASLPCVPEALIVSGILKITQFGQISPGTLHGSVSGGSDGHHKG